MKRRSAAIEAAAYLDAVAAYTSAQTFLPDLAARLRREDRERKAMERAIMLWRQRLGGRYATITSDTAALADMAKRIERRRAKRGL